MAQHNTDYGLVYDDDGKICVTKRTDIIPFSGVTSYAVETATTNYLAPHAWEFDSEQTLFYPSELAAGKTWTDCWDANQRAYVGGESLTAKTILTKSIDLGSVQTAGTKITLSWKHKGYLWYIIFAHSLDNMTYTAWNSSEIIEIKGDASFDFWGVMNDLYIRINNIVPRHDGHPEQLLDKWYNVEITYTLPVDTRYIQIVWEFYNAYAANGGLGVLGYIQKPQLEIKPFASSFVNGTRPNGRLVRPLNLLGFNPATDDWVVHYWKYPVATNTGDYNGIDLCSLGQYTHGNYEGYILWGKNTDVSFTVQAIHSDGTYSQSYSFAFDPAWYFRHWHHEVILKRTTTNGSEMQYWIDGVLEVTLVLTKALNNNFKVGLTVGGWGSVDSFANPCNSYIANLCYGLYTDQWTPEYIQEIYQQRNGFFVPPKAVIV